MPNDFLLPQGFRTAGLHCGIKTDPGRHDLALFVSDAPCAAAGVFTQNRVCGAPVKVSRERVPRASARGVIISSGNANACTGQRGLDDARWMTAESAARLGCEPDDVLVCSTGVIGHFLPREKLAAGIPSLVDRLAGDSQAFHGAARGMMTTDTFPKQAMREAEIGGVSVRVSGAAKGAAMIAPNMATMLAVIMTDAALTPDEADAMLRHAVDRSFNCISVEGHTSTSDTVLLLANGAVAGGRSAEDPVGQASPLAPPTGGARATEPQRPLGAAAMKILQQMLDDVAEDLARQIIRDAEGAAHLITIDVGGLRTRDEARRIARTIAESPLVKTAIAGADPNWGRIVSAVGYAGVDVQEEEITMRLNGTLLYQAGAPVEFDEQAVSDGIRTGRDVSIELKFPLGDAAVRFWTCDLTTEYVRLNSEYTT